MTDEDLTIQSLNRWAKRQAAAGCGVDAYTLQQASITLERVAAERDRLRDALRRLYDAQNGAPLEKYSDDWEQSMKDAGELLWDMSEGDEE